MARCSLVLLLLMVPILAGGCGDDDN